MKQFLTLSEKEDLMNVLTIEFTFLGNETAIEVEGDSCMVKVLDPYLSRHLNKNKLIVKKEKSDMLYERYKNRVTGKTKRGKRKTMLYFYEKKKENITNVSRDY